MPVTVSASSPRGPARTKREQQGERSREEILDAAERLMAARGYAATSISDLARESGLPASSIYWHFGSKSGVLGAVMERAASRFFEDGARVIEATEGEEPQARLRAVMGISGELVRDHPRFLRLFMLLLLGSEGEHAQDDVVTRVRHEGRQRITSALRLAYQPWGPQVADRIADQLGDIALALFDGYFIAVESGPAHSQARLLEQIVRTLHGLAEDLGETGRE
jgi:AcrR family transcriptional regulator